MTQLHTVEASNANLADRFRAISLTFSDTFGPPSLVQPVGELHRPTVMSWACADGVTMHRYRMSPLCLQKRAVQQRRPTDYLVWYANQASRLSLEGRDALSLQPDEVVLLTTAMAKAWRVPHDFTSSCLVIDSDLVDECLPHAVDLLGRRLGFPFGLDTVVRTLLDSAWAISVAGRFHDLGPHLARAVLNTLSAVSARVESDNRCRNHLRIRGAQARAFIDQHYTATELSVASIADHLKLSPRYIQLAFKTEGTTPSEYLRSCRLTASARLLRDPEHAGEPVTKIALACGFNGPAHFSNEFKRVYGVSPRDYRAGAHR